MSGCTAVPDSLSYGMRSILLLLLLLLPACATFIPPDVVQQKIDQANLAARQYLEEQNEPAAAQLVQAVLAIHPADPDALAFNAAFPASEFENVFPRGYLGSNRAHRTLSRSSGLARTLLYLPDRVLDLLDVFSFDVHLGWGLFLNLHVTRAVQLGAGGRVAAGLGWHDHRSFGVQTLSEGEIVIPAVGLQGIAGLLAGTSGLYSVGDGLAGVHGPMAELYQVYRDYWAVGFQATGLVGGIDFDFHPVEMADFLVGFSTVDFLHDDLAATDTISMRNTDRNLLWTLAEIRRSARSMDAYLAWRGR